MSEDSTHLPSSPGNNGEQQTVADISATNSGIARVVYLAAETGDIHKLRWMNNWKHQKTPRGNNILHIHVGKPLKIHKDVISIPFIKHVLDETSENSLLSQANDKGDTPLHFAARFGQTEAVKEFLNQAEVGIDGLLNKANSSNDTALHDAARGGYTDIVKLLVEAGGQNKNDLQYRPNNLGETPLYLAAEWGFTASFSIIVGHMSVATLGQRGPCGQTPLHAAVLCGNKDIVDQIMKKDGCSSLIRVKNDQGQTSLHCSAGQNVDIQCTSTILSALLDHDDEYNSAAYIQDNEGRTALHIAALNFNFKGACKLINSYPDCTEMVDNKGQNVVHFAAKSGSSYALKWFITKAPKCDRLINEKDNDGNTPLHLFAASSPNGHFDDWRFRLSDFINWHNDKMDIKAFNNKNLTAGDIVASNDSFLHLNLFEKLSKALPRSRRIKNGDKITKGAEREETISHEEKVKETVSNIKKAGETRLIVATLIATISFTAGFTVPGGFDQTRGPNIGLAVLAEKSAFKAFLVSDTIAFTLSSLAVVCYFGITVQNDLMLVQRLSFSANLLNTISLGALMIAFVTGVYAVISASLGLAVILISLIYFIFYLQLLGSIFWSIRRILSRVASVLLYGCKCYSINVIQPRHL